MKTGREMEENFLSAFTGMMKASFLEDVRDKKDFKQVISYQFKSLGYILRGFDRKAEHYKWVELIAVDGSQGTLTSGVDFVVFEQARYYMVVAKEHLFRFIQGKVDMTKKLTRRELEENISVDILEPLCYRPYTRKDRRDILILVPAIDIIRSGGFLIDKPSAIDHDESTLFVSTAPGSIGAFPGDPR